MIEYSQAVKHILEGKFLPAYLLTGPEALLKEEWLRLLAKKYLGEEASFRDIQRSDGKKNELSNIINALNVPALFSGGRGGRKIIVIDNPPYLPSTSKEKSKTNDEKSDKTTDTSKDDENNKKVLQVFWEKEKKKDIPDNIIIFRVFDADKRKRLFRMFNNDMKSVIDCSSLKGEELRGWVFNRLKKYGKKVDNSAYEKLLLYTGGDLWRIDREIAKLSDYMESNEDFISDELIEKLVYRGPQGDIFKLVDSLGEGNYRKAFAYLQALFHLGEAPLMILFMITRQYRMIMKVLSLREEGLSPAAISKNLGMAPFIVNKVFMQAENYKRADVRDIFKFLCETDLSIKTGRSEPEPALEILLVKISGLVKSGVRSQESEFRSQNI